MKTTSVASLFVALVPTCRDYLARVLQSTHD
jgi:hypothetical protein